MGDTVHFHLVRSFKSSCCAEWTCKFDYEIIKLYSLGVLLVVSRLSVFPSQVCACIFYEILV